MAFAPALPVFARDVLHVGPEGFGALRAGPAIGATAVALWIAAHPIRRKAGVYMFGGVAMLFDQPHRRAIHLHPGVHLNVLSLTYRGMQRSRFSTGLQAYRQC